MKKLDLAIGWLQKVEQFILAWGILSIAALTIGNVFCRTMLGFSLAFAEELCEFLMILVTFVGLSYGASRGRHIRMTAIYDQLSPRIRKVLAIVIGSSTSILAIYLTVYGIKYAAVVATLGTLSPTLQVPYFLIYLAAPLGFSLTAVHYALMTLKNIIDPEVWVSWEMRDGYDADEEIHV